MFSTNPARTSCQLRSLGSGETHRASSRIGGARGIRAYRDLTIASATRKVATLVAAAVCMGALAGCASVPSSTTDKPASFVVRDVSGTPLDGLTRELTEGKSDSESGFILIDRGHEAMEWRAFLAENATRTIDVVKRQLV